MTSIRKDQIRALLKGIETGDAAAAAVVNPDKYIQHNPQTHEGSEGLAALFKRLSESSPRVKLVRVFEDGDYVFAHTEYEFASSKVGFEVFRYEDDLVVEHWDNIQQREMPNRSGHSMVDGPTDATDLDQTEASRELVRTFVDQVLVKGQIEKLGDFVETCRSEPAPNGRDPVLAHGAELVHSKGPALAAEAVLPKEDGPAVFEPDELDSLINGVPGHLVA